MSSLSVSSATDFYQRHENKFILVIVVALSLYLIAFVAKITWSFIPQPENTNNQSSQNTSQTVSTNSNNEVNVNGITRLNLFGDAKAVPQTQAIEQDDSDAPETKLNLVLSGVVKSSDENRGAAIIEYRNAQNTYGIGDKIEGTNVTLDKIESDRVIIKNRLTRETLMLEGIDFDEANRNRAVNNNQNNVGPVQNASNTPSNAQRAQAIRNARMEMAQQPASFADLISLAPHRVEGQLIGYRVSPGKKPALFNAVGLKNGDVVLELNGLDLSDFQLAQEAITQLNEADTLQLEVLRAGEFISLELEIPEDSGT